MSHQSPSFSSMVAPSSSSPLSPSPLSPSPAASSGVFVRSADTVQVIVRTRPTDQPAAEMQARGDQTIDIHLLKPPSFPSSVAGSGPSDVPSHLSTDWSFKFDSVLFGCSQEAVYDVAARDIVENVLQGYNGTIMAYGQTGAGKTFTMSGGTLSYESRGIIPRAIGHIFRAIHERPELNFRVQVSYVEIYNEHLFDLLTAKSSSSSSSAGRSNPSVATSIDLSISEDVTSGAIQVKGLSKHGVTTEQSCLDLLFTGDSQRSIGHHILNPLSTRSHCIYTIHLETRSRIESSEKVIVSKLHLVDLAGSERVGRTGSSGILLSEAKFINKSLSFLEQVVVALSSKHRDHIPFRQSKLTLFLKDSLGGNARTRLICNIHADKPNLDESISTLKFGSRMRRVTNRAAVNVQLDPLLHVAKLQREVRELKQELAMHDTLANRLGVSYEPYAPEESVQVASMVKAYMRGRKEEIEIVNLRQVREVFRQCKIYVLEQSNGRNIKFPASSAGSVVSISNIASSNRASTPDQSLSASGSGSDNWVGDLDPSAPGAGYGFGHVDSHARPLSRPDSRDEPLKPKNIIRQRARAGGLNNGGNGAVGAEVDERDVRATASAASRRGVAAAAAQQSAQQAQAQAGFQLPHVSSASNNSNGNARQNANGAGVLQRHTAFSEEKNNVARPAANNGSPSSASAARAQSQSASYVNESHAFDAFKSSPLGFDLSSALSTAKRSHHAHRSELRDATNKLNAVQKRIAADTKALKLEQEEREKRDASSSPDAASSTSLGVIDESEYVLLQSLSALKSDYRSLSSVRAASDASAFESKQLVESMRANLFVGFKDWYRDEYGVEPTGRGGAGGSGAEGADESSNINDANDGDITSADHRHDERAGAGVGGMNASSRHIASMSIKAKQGRRPFVGAAFK